MEIKENRGLPMGMYSRIRGSLDKPGGGKKGHATASTAIAPSKRATVAAPKPQKKESELEVCERIIAAGLDRMNLAFRDIAENVARVKDKRLYKLASFSSFEDWCQKKWGWSADRGYQFATANATLESLPGELPTIVGNEAQARALSMVPERKRASVLKRVAAAGPVTAKAIKAGHVRLAVNVLATELGDEGKAMAIMRDYRDKGTSDLIPNPQKPQ